MTRTNGWKRLLPGVFAVLMFAGVAAAAPLTVLPDNPVITDLDGTQFAQHSASNFTVFYNLPGESDWDGVMIRWDDWGPRDLSAITQFVFGVTGTPAQVKVEFEDADTNKTAIILDGVDGEYHQWNIPSDLITLSDLSAIRVISFVVDRALAGTDNTNGHYTVFVEGLDFRPGTGNYDVSASAPTGTLTTLPDNPLVNDLDGTLYAKHSASNFSVYYNLPGPNDWDGVMIRWENFAAQNLTSFDEFVFGVTGTPQAIKIEFEDSDGVKTIFNLRGLTNTLQHWHIAASLVTNLHKIKNISFVIDRALAGDGNTSGQYTVFTGGLDDTPGQGVYDAPSFAFGPISTLTGEPQVDPLGTTPFVQHSTSNFTTFYDLATPDSWNGSMIHWSDWSGRDLSEFAVLVFAVTGTPSSIKAEFEDTNGVKTVFNLNAITGTKKYYWIDTTLITNVQSIKVISFVVDRTAAGAGNTNGQYTVFVGGLKPLSSTGIYDVNPSDSGLTEITWLPGPGDQPMISDLGGTVYKQHSSSNFTVFYNITNETVWNGVMVHWDGFPGRDLSSITQFVFGVTGTAQSVKLEFEDGYTNKTVFNLRGVTNTMQHYVIPASMITNVNYIKVMSFVVDGALTGAGNTNGQFTVFVRGLGYLWLVDGALSGTPTVLPGLPDAIAVGGANGDTVVVNTNPSLISVTYNVETGGWSGATILYDNYGTVPIESEDLSGFSEFVFGLYGDPASVNVEFMDDEGRVVLGRAFNVGATPKYYTFDAGMVTCDVTRVRMINFVVDQALAGEGGEAGTLHILSGGLNYRYSILGQTTGKVSNLPVNSVGDAAVAIPVGGANGDTVVTQPDDMSVNVVYDVVTGGWSGVTFLFDDYSTEPVETADLSGPTSLVFRAKGDPCSLKFEIEDADTNKVSGFFDGLSDTWQYFQIASADLEAMGLDLSRVRMISIVVDQNVTCGANAGAFDVQVLGLDYDYQIEVGGEATGTLSMFPPPAPKVDLVGGGNGDTVIEQYDTNLFRVIYNVTTGGWSGASVLYDDFGSVPVESGNLDGIGDFVIRVRGTASAIQFEFQDADGARVSGRMTGIGADWLYFALPLDDIAARGVNMEEIAVVSFVITSDLAGAGNTEGFVDFETLGLSFANPAYGMRDEDGDGIPDDWEDDNFGTTTGAVASAHSDEDGVPDGDEFLAGTNPFDSDSYPMLDIVRQGTNFVLRIGAINQRLYQILRTTNLVSGIWEDVTARILAEADGDMVLLDDLGIIGQAYYRCRIRYSPESPLPGRPGVVLTGGSNGDATLHQASARQFSVVYNVVTGGYAGGTITFDDYGTEEVEFADLSGYDFLTFGVSGTPAHIKYEFEDVETNRVIGSFRYVTGEMRDYRIDMNWLAAGAFDVTRVRSIHFIVDPLHAGAALTGSFTIQSCGLNYSIQAEGQEAGAATELPPPDAITYDLGGANSSGNWSVDGGTNILVNYNVSGGGWEGVTLSHDDFGTADVECANYKGMGSVVFGVYGSVDSVKIEFVDALDYKVIAILNNVEPGQKFYSVSVADLEDLGLVVSRVRLVSFVVDQGLAGDGNHVGAFHVVADGLAP